MFITRLLTVLIIHLLTPTTKSTPDYYPEYKPTQNYRDTKNTVPIISETNQIDYNGDFAYSYATGDGQQVQAQGYLKNAGNKGSESEVIQGSYSYTAPDGTPITVSYIADEFGFRAEGAHLPTPPPIPEAIKKSLEFIAKAQGRAGVDYNAINNNNNNNVNEDNYRRRRPFGKYKYRY